MNAFSCGWGDVGGSLQVVLLGYEFVDNAVTYLTPKFGGLDAVFQYSFGADTQTDAYKDGTEGKSSVVRMYAAALRYQNSTVLVSAGIEGINQDQPSAERKVSTTRCPSTSAAATTRALPSSTPTARSSRTTPRRPRSRCSACRSASTATASTSAPKRRPWGGNVKASFGWGDFEGSHADNPTMTTYQTAVGYAYSLSRRTTLYTAAGWIHNDFSNDYAVQKPTAVENDYEWICGITHKF